MERIRFAIVGCGQNAHKHSEVVSDIPYLELVAVCDSNLSRAEDFASQYKVKKVYMDYRELLEKEDLDFVSISTPHSSHYEIAKFALNSKVNVLVEKPLALSLEEAKELCFLSDNLGLKLGMVVQMRYNPLIELAQEAVRNGALGIPFLGSVHMLWYRPQEYFENSWRGSKNYDGGMLYNMAIHYLDLLILFFGEVQSAYAMAGTFTHSIETEDTLVAVLRFYNGTLATFEGSFSIYPQNLETSLSIFGDKGTIVIGGLALNSINAWRIKDNVISPKVITYDPLYLRRLCFKNMVLDFCNGIIKNTPTRIDAVSSLLVLETIDTIYKSLREG
ncbi:MAG: Gfo/Idh/MocA family oxidoreductase [bacterium]|nr:Gfo/Idh/MocA family oxidoreductase [bacterium]